MSEVSKTTDGPLVRCHLTAVLSTLSLHCIQAYSHLQTPSLVKPSKLTPLQCLLASLPMLNPNLRRTALLAERWGVDTELDSSSVPSLYRSEKDPNSPMVVPGSQ